MTRPREAIAWGFLGAAGVVLAAAGLILVFVDGGGGAPAAGIGRNPVTPRPTATATRTPTAVRTTAASTTAVTATRTRTPGPSPTFTVVPGTPTGPVPTATPTPPEPEPTPPDTPTAPDPTATPPPPTATATDTPPATLSYCPGSVTGPPFILAGLVSIGGEPVPPGTSIVILFDGVGGPAGRVTAGDGATGYKLYFVRDASPGCANAPGAGIALLVNGAFVATGLGVPTGPSSAFLQFDVQVP